MSPEAAYGKRKVGFLLGLGIFLIPFLFVWFLLRKGHTPLSRGIGFAWLAISMVGAIAGGGKEASNAKVAPIAQPPAYSIPQDQADFMTAVNSAKELYRIAPNELKKSAVRTDRSGAIAVALRNNHSITGWVGEITQLKTNNDGKAYIEIKLIGSESNIMIKTWNNALSDVGSNTLIPQDSPLFQIIANMSEGEKVEFGGTFGSGKDFINESSMSESGSMLDPEFILKFKSIKKI